MKVKYIIGTAFLMVSLMIVESCKKKEIQNESTSLSEAVESKKGETKISSHGQSDSHNMGQNCMNCHKSGGSGEGWFTVAATVYDSLQTTPLPNATVRLYTSANGGGTLKYTIEVDAKGNFYTTAPIDWGNGLYPSVQGANGTHYMSSAINTGNCSSCHGSSTGKIWTK